MGDFVDAIGRGVGGLVGGAVDAISDAFDTIVATLQVMLPGPLFPITLVAIGGLAAWWFFKK